MIHTHKVDFREDCGAGEHGGEVLNVFELRFGGRKAFVEIQTDRNEWCQWFLECRLILRESGDTCRRDRF